MIKNNGLAYTALFTTIAGYGAIRATAIEPTCTAADLIMAVPMAVFAYCTAKTIGGKALASLKKIFGFESNLEIKMGD